MQTLRNPLSIFRARSRSRECSSGSQSQSRKPEKNVQSKPAVTQKLYVKRDKQASECLAETKIEKKSVCREKTHKSIVIPQPRIYVCEKIEKTVHIPKMSSVVTTPKSSLSQKSTSGSKKTHEMIEEIFAPLRDTIEQGIKELRHNSSSPEKVKSLNHTPSTRLEQWKAQLIGGSASATTTTISRTRDLSAPAPVQRLRMKPQQTQLRVPPAPTPRQIHSTQSATNALASMDHRTLREVPMRNHSGTWQPNFTHSYITDRPVDFVTSPRLTHQEVICRPIAFRPKPAELINHNDSNKKSFKRVDATIRSDDANGSISDLLLMYKNKDREMNSSMRSSASLNSSLYRGSFPSDQHNNHSKTVMTTLSSSSSGIHVTPSPSDSGIIDYEHLIRDKEQELQEIRNVMEQNEDIIIKVYQDKERAWNTELEGLKCRVMAAEKGEKALREQLSNCQRQNNAMSQCMRGLQEEKTKLMAKCIQLDKEIEYLRQVAMKPCSNCNTIQNNEQQKDLRQEVMDLRREVALLKRVVDDEIQFKN